MNNSTAVGVARDELEGVPLILALGGICPFLIPNDQLSDSLTIESSVRHPSSNWE